VFLARTSEQEMHNLEIVTAVLIKETCKYYLLLNLVPITNDLFRDADTKYFV
jgi:hypothetical protein